VIGVKNINVVVKNDKWALLESKATVAQK